MHNNKGPSVTGIPFGSTRQAGPLRFAGRTIVAMRFAYPPDAPKGKLLILFSSKGGTSSEKQNGDRITVVDVATRTVDARVNQHALTADVAALLASAASPDPSFGVGGWLNHGLRVTLRIVDRQGIECGALELARPAPGGGPRRWQFVSAAGANGAAAPVDALALDRLGGGFASATSSVADGSTVALWSFSRRGAPASFEQFLDLPPSGGGRSKL